MIPTDGVLLSMAYSKTLLRVAVTGVALVGDVKRSIVNGNGDGVDEVFEVGEDERRTAGRKL